MELFKAFLDETSGKHLFNFWLDAERFKDSLESEPEETLREQMTKLFRYVGTVSKVMDIFYENTVNSHSAAVFRK